MDVLEEYLCLERENRVLFRGAFALEREIRSRLGPAIAVERSVLQEHRQALDLIAQTRQRADPAIARAAALEQQLARAEHEASVLRNSLTWRLTAPVRRLIDFLLHRSPG